MNELSKMNKDRICPICLWNNTYRVSHAKYTRQMLHEFKEIEEHWLCSHCHNEFHITYRIEENKNV